MSFSSQSGCSSPPFIDDESQWTTKDDRRLVAAYVSMHKTVAEHIEPLFGNKLHEAFHSTVEDPEDVRPYKELTERWAAIKKDVTIFNQIYKTIRTQFPHESKVVHLTKSNELFKTLNEGKMFDLEDAWNILNRSGFADNGTAPRGIVRPRGQILVMTNNSLRNVRICAVPSLTFAE